MVTWIKNRVGNYSRTEILSTISMFVDELLSDNTMQVIRINPATGMPPFLATTQGVRQYTCPADCRQTVAVFTERIGRAYNDRPGSTIATEYLHASKNFHKVAIRSTQADENNLATVTFIDDPETTTDRYYHQYYYRPVRLLTERQEIAIPAKVHRYIADGVIEIFKTENYGNTERSFQVIENIKRTVRNTMNRGANPRLDRTVWPEEYRDY
jgi:hypothetical protein